MRLKVNRAWARLVSLIWGGTREDGRIDRVVARDEIGHDGLGLFLSLAEAIGFLFPLEVKEAGEQSVHLLPERNTKVLGVKEDMMLEGVVNPFVSDCWPGSTAAPRASPWRSTRRLVLPMREPSAACTVGPRAPVTRVTTAPENKA